MAKKISPLASYVKPAIPRKKVQPRRVVNRYIYSEETKNAINKINLILPSSGSSVPAGDGFSYGGASYKNNTDTDIQMPEYGHQNFLNSGFSLSSVASSFVYNISTDSDINISSSDVLVSDNTYGISARTASNTVTITIPSGLEDGAEFYIDNIDGVNDLTVVVESQAENIDSSPTGLTWSNRSGFTLKKENGSWIIFSRRSG